ncbi:MAG: baseplate J/gp47 family protein [Gammaproteobacteria bacterium]|nr:baseplate J/gp47 family protein [Gammaproteobacteria bacterium]
MPIDYQALAPAPVIAEIDYQTELDQMKAELVTKDGTLAEVLDNPAEPLTMLLEVAAYRLMIKSQELNDRAQGLLLAYATGADLDHIGITYFRTQRLVIDAGDPLAVPPAGPTYETDDDYRARCAIAEDAFSTAGPRAAYVYFAKSASGEVKDVGAISPSPSNVTVAVLSHTGDGTASSALLQAVTDALDDSRRPMTDNLTIQSATIKSYTINATIKTYPGYNREVVRQASEAAGVAFGSNNHKLGLDIVLVQLTKALAVPGVMDITLNNTIAGDIVSNIVNNDTEAAYCAGVTVALGAVDE